MARQFDFEVAPFTAYSELDARSEIGESEGERGFPRSSPRSAPRSRSTMMRRPRRRPAYRPGRPPFPRPRPYVGGGWLGPSVVIEPIDFGEPPAAPEPAGPDDAAAPAAADDGAQSAADSNGGDGELYGAFEIGEAAVSSEAEQELKFSASYEVLLTAGPRVKIPNSKSLEQLPTQRGIYFIYVNDVLWYVGKADSIRGRFQDRFKTFHDFKIPADSYLPWLQRISVGWYLLTFKGSPVARGIHSWSTKTSTWVPVVAKGQALLRAVEQHYIKTLGPRGNAATECVRFKDKDGVLKIVFADGRSPVTMSSVFCEKKPVR